MKKTVAILLLMAAQTANAGSVCESAAGFDKVLCFGAAGAALLVGGGSYLGEAVFSAIAPRTEVQVELPNGTRITGKATRNLLVDRTVQPGQVLTLTCAVNNPLQAGEYGYAACELKFPRVAPRPTSTDYYEREGRQPSWGFGASRNGFTDPDLLTLSRPLIWQQGIGN